MPRRRQATEADVRAFVRAGMILPGVKGEELIDKINRVEYELSEFSDPGDDWTALYFEGRQVGYWPGY